MARYDDGLKCNVETVEWGGDGVVVYRLADGECSDRDGTIKDACVKDPDVDHVEVFSGDHRTLYLRFGDQWESHRV